MLIKTAKLHKNIKYFAASTTLFPSSTSTLMDEVTLSHKRTKRIYTENYYSLIKIIRRWISHHDLFQLRMRKFNIMHKKGRIQKILCSFLQGCELKPTRHMTRKTSISKMNQHMRKLLIPTLVTSYHKVILPEKYTSTMIMLYSKHIICKSIGLQGIKTSFPHRHSKKLCQNSALPSISILESIPTMLAR